MDHSIDHTIGPLAATSLSAPSQCAAHGVADRRDYRFPKAEHLSLQRDIDALFSEGSRSTAAFPVRAVWRTVEWDGRGPRVKVMVSVSKRKFRHAVDRNRAKRQMREAYRLHKHILLAPVAGGDGLPALHIGLIWLASEPQDSRLVHRRVVTLLHRIAEAISPAVPSSPAVSTPSE